MDCHQKPSTPWAAPAWSTGILISRCFQIFNNSTPFKYLAVLSQPIIIKMPYLKAFLQVLNCLITKKWFHIVILAKSIECHWLWIFWDTSGTYLIPNNNKTKSMICNTECKDICRIKSRNFDQILTYRNHRHSGQKVCLMFRLFWQLQRWKKTEFLNTNKMMWTIFVWCLGLIHEYNIMHSPVFLDMANLSNLVKQSYLHMKIVVSKICALWHKKLLNCC